MAFQPKGSQFQPRTAPTEAGVAKFVAGAGVPVLEKVGAGERELGLPRPGRSS